MEPTADAIYVGDLLGGPSQIRRFGLDGTGGTIVPIPNISAITEMESLEDDSLLFRDVSYTEPAAWFHLTGMLHRKRRRWLIAHRLHLLTSK